MKKHNHCFICESEQIEPMKGYRKKGHELLKCLACGFVFMENIPTSKELEAHYNTYSYASQGFLSPATVKSYHKLLGKLEKYRKLNKILDVGCGRGWFLNEAKKRGWEVYGTEFSQKAFDICSENNITMKKGTLKASDFKPETFDVITSFEVIEHINHPHQDLEAISIWLRRGGLFFCTTPNFNALLRYYLKTDYDMIGYPEHLSYYTKSTLNRVAQKHGLRAVKFESTGFSITTYKNAKHSGIERRMSETSSDEKLRQAITRKWYLALLKSVLNKILTLTNLGETLKGYYVKKSMQEEC